MVLLRACLFLLLCVTPSFGAASGEEFSSDAQKQAFSRLTSTLFAPCCWHEAIASHDSAIAGQLRQEIAGRLSKGESEEAIRTLLVSRYGERIMTEPRGTKRDVLYLGLLAGFASGAFLLGFLLWRAKQQSSPAPLLSAPIADPGWAAIEQEF